MKKNILITQRSEHMEDRNESRDSLDQNFAKLFSSNINIIPVASTMSHPEEFAKEMNCKGIILSGGNTIFEDNSSTSPQRLETEISLLNYAKRESLPVFGVCYGMHVLNHYCGGSTKRNSGDHTNVVHDITFLNKKLTTNSFHNFSIFKACLAKEFQVLGKAKDQSVESFIHEKLPWFGVMWHPERELAFNKPFIDTIIKIFTYDGLDSGSSYINGILADFINKGH